MTRLAMWPKSHHFGELTAQSCAPELRAITDGATSVLAKKIE
jgi:hypothetical protein